MATDPIGKQNFSAAPVHRSETQSTDNSSAVVGAAVGTGLAFAAQLAGRAFASSPYGALPSMIAGGLGIGGGGIGGVQSDISQGQNQMMEMLRIQNQMQIQNQQFTTMTNVSKMDHETRMAAVRNIRT
jgi:hypothetical protein